MLVLVVQSRLRLLITKKHIKRNGFLTMSIHIDLNPIRDLLLTYNY